MMSSSGEIGVTGSLPTLPFLHTWKLERLFSLVSDSGKMWDYSGVFLTGGYGWKLALKFGEVEANGGKSYLSLFMALVGSSPNPLHIEVVVESSILDEIYSQHTKRTVIRSFRQSRRDECCPYFISLETLDCDSSGFLVVEIIDVVIHSKNKYSLSPNPNNNSVAYTWIIDDFSKLTDGCYTSSSFLYNDHTWYLQLYPNGCVDEKNKSISLYLILDYVSDPPFVSICVEFYIDLVDQNKGNYNHRLRCDHIFESDSPLGGWRKFLSLEELHEPSKGLLVNDSCIVRVGFLECNVTE